MIEVWENFKMCPEKELPQSPTDSDENEDSTALLALVGGDIEEEKDVIEQVLVGAKKKKDKCETMIAL
jgi:hypothetical protein